MLSHLRFYDLYPFGFLQSHNCTRSLFLTLCSTNRFRGLVAVILEETGTRKKKKEKPVKLDDVLSQESENKSCCSGSDASPESYNDEDSSRVPTDDDNGTDLYGVGEEKEAELWREIAFAQESSKVTVENVQDIDLDQNVPPGRVVSATLNPKRNVKGAASSTEIGNNNNKRKRIDEKPKKVSAEEKAALRQEAARKRVEDREKSLLGLCNRTF
ncbi:unnamed protein product [Eruca vesicaria subsp. sativa]|uniref:Uncharacterized protein n=1 Tax=Eruca vesicaria subsp. sativa TaxID=29727 RepID=A0ABC8KG37_ERUVS|nr:unnamed protein product [Eruca vesicaria subsp. sativa]